MTAVTTAPRPVRSDVRIVRGWRCGPGSGPRCAAPSPVTSMRPAIRAEIFNTDLTRQSACVAPSAGTFGSEEER